MEMEGGAKIRWLITHRNGAENFSLRVIEVKNGENTPYHEHDYEHEIYVIKGKVEVTIGEEKHIASADDYVLIPPNAHHGLKALEDLKFVCVVPVRVAREMFDKLSH